MTKEEIEKLVFNAGTINELPRLLRLIEERKRLLEAMREIYHEHEFDRRTEIARRAILFAEAPAD